MNKKQKSDCNRLKSMWAVEEIVSDDDDKDIEEMQREVEDILSKITAKKRKTVDTNQVPVQFSVKVEVEECNEPPPPQPNERSQNDQDKIKTANNSNSLLNISQKQDSTVKPREYRLIIKNNGINLSQTPPSTSGDDKVFKPTPTILNYYNKFQNRPEETHYLINNTGNEITQKRPLNKDKYKHFTFSDIQIKDEMERLSMLSTNPVDKHVHMLAKNIMNVPTVVTKTPQEAALEKVLVQWRDWYLEAPSIRDTPSQYKCRSCGEAWWHLYEFQEHLDTQHKPFHVDVTLKFQAAHHESYITAKKKYASDKITRRILTPCWKCGLTCEEKYKNYDVRNHIYWCVCGSHLPTCKLYRLHLDVCPIGNNKAIYKCHLCFLKFTSAETLTKHKMLSHSVRSDLPFAWPKFLCKLCAIPLDNILCHDCPKMTQDILCCYCTKTFTSTPFLNLHHDFAKDNVKCRYCDHIMLKGCMELEHLMEHTENYTLLYKCRVCEDSKLFLESNSYNIHLLAKHPSVDRIASRVPVPVKCIQMAGYTVPPRKIHKACNEGTFETASSPRTRKDENKSLDEKDKPANDRNKDLNPNESSNVEVKEDNIEEYINSHKEIDHMILHRNNQSPEPILDDKEIKKETPENLNDNRIDMKLDDDRKEREQETSDGIDIFKNIKIKEEIVEDSNIDEHMNILTNINDLINDNIKVEVKEEPDDEYFEDDIIILNENSLLNVDITDDAVSDVGDDNDGDGDADGDGDSDYDMDTDDNSDTNTRIYKRLYTCKRCNFKGTYNLFKLHKQEHCIKKGSAKRKSYAVWQNRNIECSRCNKKFKTLKWYLLHLISHNYTKLTCPGCMVKQPHLKKLITHVTSEITKSVISVRSIRTNSDNDRKFRYQCKKCKNYLKVNDSFQHWEQHLVMPGDMPDDSNWEKFAPKTPLLRECVALLLGVPYTGEVEPVSQDPDLRWCKICHRRFERRNDSKRHFIEHLLDDAYINVVLNKGLKCQICGEVFSKNFAYKSHMRYHASLPVYKCELCNKSFSDSSNFAKHRKVHNISVLMCDICQKKFHVKHQLVKHLKDHESFVCNVDNCKRICYSQSSHKKHLRQVHMKQDPQYTCFICKEKFKSIKNKWDHQWTVHQLRKSVADCPVCQKAFRKISDVKRHVEAAHSETDKGRKNTKRPVVVKDASETKGMDDEERELQEVTEGKSEPYMFYS